jgi:hypothetical protein
MLSSASRSCTTSRARSPLRLLARLQQLALRHREQHAHRALAHDGGQHARVGADEVAGRGAARPMRPVIGDLISV